MYSVKEKVLSHSGEDEKRIELSANSGILKVVRFSIYGEALEIAANGNKRFVYVYNSKEYGSANFHVHLENGEVLKVEPEQYRNQGQSSGERFTEPARDPEEDSPVNYYRMLTGKYRNKVSEIGNVPLIFRSSCFSVQGFDMVEMPKPTLTQEEINKLLQEGTTSGIVYNLDTSEFILIIGKTSRVYSSNSYISKYSHPRNVEDYSSGFFKSSIIELVRTSYRTPLYGQYSDLSYNEKSFFPSYFFLEGKEFRFGVSPNDEDAPTLKVRNYQKEMAKSVNIEPILIEDGIEKTEKWGFIEDVELREIKYGMNKLSKQEKQSGIFYT